MHRILIVFAVTAAVLWLTFYAAQKHADDSAVPRYCSDRAGVLARVEKILTSGKPVGNGSKRPYIIAAKLIFLVPQREGESVKDYIARLARHLDDVC
ncbi:MAG TPA: hypothetical protein ENJ99_01185 [Rhizobiales bacterium]|nr:hypothetical protein [Hyphomicrobiales bacterium]